MSSVDPPIVVIFAVGREEGEGGGGRGREGERGGGRGGGEREGGGGRGGGEREGGGGRGGGEREGGGGRGGGERRKRRQRESRKERGKEEENVMRASLLKVAKQQQSHTLQLQWLYLHGVFVLGDSLPFRVVEVTESVT